MQARRTHSSSPARCGRRLQHILHDVLSNPVAHVGSDAGREAIVKAGPDAGVRNLLGKGRHVGEAVSHAARIRTGHRNFGDVRRAKRSFDDTRDATAEDAVRAWIFWMHWRV